MKARFGDIENMQAASRLPLDLCDWIPGIMKFKCGLSQFLEEEFIEVDWGTVIKIVHATQGELAEFTMLEKEPEPEYYHGMPMHVDRGVALSSVLEAAWPYESRKKKKGRSVRDSLLSDIEHPLSACQIRLYDRGVNSKGKRVLEINLSLHDDIIAMDKREEERLEMEAEKDPVRKSELQEKIKQKQRVETAEIIAKIPDTLKKAGLDVDEKEVTKIKLELSTDEVEKEENTRKKKGTKRVAEETEKDKDSAARVTRSRARGK